jgi:hypothetical protein
MMLIDGVWRLWREARLLAALHRVFAGDGRTIKGAWEGSADGSRWKHDFDLNYPRPGVTGLRPEAGTGGDRAAAKG